MSHRHSVPLFVAVGLAFLFYGGSIILYIRAAVRERIHGRR